MGNVTRYRRLLQFRVPSSTFRAGLTLVELLIAVAIMSLTAMALGTLARATQISASYVQGHSSAAQHARVTMERIQHAVQTATANETFPAAALFAESVSGNRFPDTLVVWKPAEGTTVSNPSGLPLFSELAVFCPNPTRANELLEITSRSDLRTVPALSNTSQWTTELTTLKTGNTSKKVVLTDLLRTASADGSGAARGCARFEVLLRPSAAEISSYRSGTLAWNAISWPQHWYGENTGMRQTWVRMELQLMPNSRAGGEAPTALAIPFIGSAALYYDISK
jgi:prepilin-type N-terminal cleavage/methylation domain-containing protein